MLDGRAVGTDPFVSNGITVRKSIAVPEGMQTFWDGATPIAVDRFPASRPDLVGKFNTIVLNPLEYEVVKKSVMEAPRRDRARELKRGNKAKKRL